jgi:diphthine synthase
MTLHLIGLGLDMKDISLKALETIKKCKKVYLENYTVAFPYTAKELEKVIKKKTVPANRKTVEEKNVIVEDARGMDVAMLVYGDPLSATTHADIVMRAKKEGIEVEIIHCNSIINAVADTGLQIYKFGKTASIAKWQNPSFRPESFYDVVIQNQKIGAHTLLLLDIGLSVNEALSYLESMAKTKDAQISGWEFIVCERMGLSKQRITFGKIDELIDKKFSMPACLIVPGQMHFLEREMLETWKGKK